MYTIRSYEYSSRGYSFENEKSKLIDQQTYYYDTPGELYSVLLSGGFRPSQLNIVNEYGERLEAGEYFCLNLYDPNGQMFSIEKLSEMIPWSKCYPIKGVRRSGGTHRRKRYRKMRWPKHCNIKHWLFCKDILECESKYFPALKQKKARASNKSQDLLFYDFDWRSNKPSWKTQRKEHQWE